MSLHVLNGDALAEKFPIEGNVIVCRECLIEGPVDANDLATFWKDRSKYLCGDSNAAGYYTGVIAEFEKLKTSLSSEINLWFEHDLFCQVNLWFTIDFIQTNFADAKIYLVMPEPEKDINWSGFGSMNTGDLKACFEHRVLMTETDLQLAQALWNAYRLPDMVTLLSLSRNNSTSFPKLREVCEAYADYASESSNGRPQRKLKSILDSGVTEFQSIFTEFRKSEAIYGFGDTQVKRLLQSLAQS